MTIRRELIDELLKDYETPQEILGHSNFNVTANLYSHVLPTMQQEAMDKMDSFLGSNFNELLFNLAFPHF